MAFTTQLFLFAFFPLSLVVCLLSQWLQDRRILSGLLERLRLADLALIGVGCLFYLWTCFDDLLRLLAYIAVVWLLGLVIGRCRSGGTGLLLERKSPEREQWSIPLSAVVLTAGVTFLVWVLVHFKYTDMLAQVWNFFFKDHRTGSGAAALLGISFITFSAISYLADICKGKAEPGKLIDCILYLTFFPKVVSGPIVLWRDFQPQIPRRRMTMEGFSEGAQRMMMGFAKKLILADTFGTCVASASAAVDVPTAWGIGLLYMLQIYYDFSGYSDAALGLSRMLGFEFKENFDFPYISTSITEFWRRWHISLGTWFREYIYFPLGGSRAGTARTLVNIGVVFLLTGVWHGAGWTYMLWGILNGLCNIAEKLLKDNRLYQRTPKLLKWAATMTVTYFAWELFRFEDFSACLRWFGVMFGLVRFESIPYGWQYYFDLRMIVLAVVGILGATVWGLPRVQAAYKRFTGSRWGYLVHGLVLVVLFGISILFMVNSKYSPFIYFQY